MSVAQAIEEPALQRAHVNGIGLAFFEWSARERGRGPTLLLLHATGFHARCWDPIVRRLGPRHVLALDQRGHGRSEKTPIAHWRVFGEDVAAFVRARPGEAFVGVGHSMGGHALVDAAAALPERFPRLVLIDPVIGDPTTYGPGGGWRAELPPGEVHPTAKRKRFFASPREMFERFRERRPYSLFTEEALWAYCEHGLLALADGEGFELACPPETEASIYMTSRSNAGVIDSARRVQAPALVVRAKAPPPDRGLMDFESSPTWPGLAAAMPRGRDLHLPEWTHFLPMQAPELVAKWLEAELAEAARASGA
jgi:pimeloyl-ACP methyl ester carboxylesterase